MGLLGVTVIPVRLQLCTVRVAQSVSAAPQEANVPEIFARICVVPGLLVALARPGSVSVEVSTVA